MTKKADSTEIVCFKKHYFLKKSGRVIYAIVDKNGITLETGEIERKFVFINSKSTTMKVIGELIIQASKLPKLGGD